MRVAVVTDAASGIGLALTERLLQEKWQVDAIVRNRMPDTPNMRGATYDGRLRVYGCDLADAASRHAVIVQIAADEPKIDALFSNAGVSTGKLERSPQGHELHYEVNTIAPYVLTIGLLDKLELSKAARVVNTSSGIVKFTKEYSPSTLEHPERFKVLFGPYATSKLALTLWSQAIAQMLSDRRVTVVSVDPGPNRTPLIQGPGMPFLMRLLATPFLRPPSYGASLLFEAAMKTYAPGAFISGSKITTIPFLSEAKPTLQAIMQAVN